MAVDMELSGKRLDGDVSQLPSDRDASKILIGIIVVIALWCYPIYLLVRPTPVAPPIEQKFYAVDQGYAIGYQLGSTAGLNGSMLPASHIMEAIAETQAQQHTWTSRHDRERFKIGVKRGYEKGWASGMRRDGFSR